MKFFLMLVFVCGSSLWASESLNEQIEAMQHATPQERVAKMNRLKTQIASMNEEERLKAIETLQSMQNGSGQRLQLRLQNGMTNSPAMMQKNRTYQNNISPKMQGR